MAAETKKATAWCSPADGFWTKRAATFACTTAEPIAAWLWPPRKSRTCSTIYASAPLLPLERAKACQYSNNDPRPNRGREHQQGREEVDAHRHDSSGVGAAASAPGKPERFQQRRSPGRTPG